MKRIDVLIGKRVFLVNPKGYPGYRGIVRSRCERLKGSVLYDDWVEIDWEWPGVPCTTPMEIKHLTLKRRKRTASNSLT